MFIYKVVSVLISNKSVMSMPQFSQSFASTGLVDSYGNAISKSIYTDSSGIFITDGVPEIINGLVPPFSGNSNEIDRLEPEPILIIKPPPFSRKPKTTKTYTTAPTLATTRVPVTFRTNPPPTFAPVTARTNPPPTFAPVTVRTLPPAVAPIFRTTQAPRILAKPPAPFIQRQQTFSNFRGSNEDGKYRGKSDDGTYRPRAYNTGAYVHDNSGAYRHTNAGAYKHDDRGKYQKN